MTPAGTPVAEHGRRDDAGQSHDGAHREVDTAGDDDERHAARQDDQIGVVDEERRKDAGLDQTRNESARR